MFCTNCGYELKEGDRFCENCGTPVENPPVENPPVENPVKTIKEEPVPIQPENTALPPESTEEQTGVTESEAAVKMPEQPEEAASGDAIPELEKQIMKNMENELILEMPEEAMRNGTRV